MVDKNIILKDILVVLLVTYVILFSSLIVHELGHYAVETYVVRECGVTNIVLSFDLLFLERHGLTYIACTDFQSVSPYAILDISKPTRPVIDITLGATKEGKGHPTAMGLTASAVSGPLAELLFMTALVYVLYSRYRDVRFLKAVYPLYVLSVFVAAQYDIMYASPTKDETLFMLFYYGAYAAFAIAYYDLMKPFNRPKQ